jgi:hypothetical protein
MGRVLTPRLCAGIGVYSARSLAKDSSVSRIHLIRLPFPRGFRANRLGYSCNQRLSRLRAKSLSCVLARLTEEPCALLRIVDPDLDQAGGRHIAGLLADAMHIVQPGG